VGAGRSFGRCATGARSGDAVTPTIRPRRSSGRQACSARRISGELRLLARQRASRRDAGTRALGVTARTQRTERRKDQVMQRASSLALLEPPCPTGAAGAAFMEVMSPIIERYHAGDTVGAVADVYGLIGDPPWRDTIERTIRRRCPSREERSHQLRDRGSRSRRLVLRPRAGRHSYLPGALHVPGDGTAMSRLSSKRPTTARGPDSFRRSRNGSNHDHPDE
jgi:hypothetical protein